MTPPQELSTTWHCPNCFQALDISAPKRTGVKVYPCRRAGVDWERAAGMLRVVQASRGNRDGPGGADEAEMMLAMRNKAVRSELTAFRARTKAARERARWRSDAVAWWSSETSSCGSEGQR